MYNLSLFALPLWSSAFMSLTATDVKKIAHLARLNMSEEEIATYTKQLSTILNFVEQMNQANTDNIKPIAHSLDFSQRMRADEVTETDQRKAFQAIAPQVEAGLYLVPQVIEGE
jgi:aspartyl-tRNA(Asn)/glutamyl-tRNA(Gln) amidotransferase subunit C